MLRRRNPKGEGNRKDYCNAVVFEASTAVGNLKQRRS